MVASHSSDKNNFLNNEITNEYNNQIQIKPIKIIKNPEDKSKSLYFENNYYYNNFNSPIINNKLNQNNLYTSPKHSQHNYTNDLRKSPNSGDVNDNLFFNLKPTINKKLEYELENTITKSPVKKKINLFYEDKRYNFFSENFDKNIMNKINVYESLNYNNEKIPKNSKPKTIQELEIAKAKIIMKRKLNKTNINENYPDFKTNSDFNEKYIYKNITNSINSNDLNYFTSNLKIKENIKEEYNNSKQPMDNLKSKAARIKQKNNKNILNINILKNNDNNIKKQKYPTEEFIAKEKNNFHNIFNIENKPFNFDESNNRYIKNVNNLIKKENKKLIRLEKLPSDNRKHKIDLSDNNLNSIKNNKIIINFTDNGNKNQTNNKNEVTDNQIPNVFLDEYLKNINNNFRRNNPNSKKNNINKAKFIHTINSKITNKKIEELNNDKINVTQNKEKNNNNEFTEFKNKDFDLYIFETKSDKKQKKLNNVNKNKIDKKIKKKIVKKIDLKELKIYLKDINITPIYVKRKSFDCIMGKKIFDMLNKDNLETKTFNSEDYTIIRQIGKGSYGKIYLVEDPKTKKNYALKKVPIGDVYDLKINQDEYRLTRKLLQTNPELMIVKKYGIEFKKLDKYNLMMYVLMEAANCDWEQEILNRQKDKAYYKEIEIVNILKSLVETFSILQKKGISHRDVKPQNILCFGKDGYKISDFGEAKTKKRELGGMKNIDYDLNTKKQTIRGTELYMSPILFNALQNKKNETVKYNAYKSDVFSLGMCFLLASSLDFEALYKIREEKNMEIVKESIFKYLKGKFSNHYINLLIMMLNVDEKLRPDFVELNDMIM